MVQVKKVQQHQLVYNLKEKITEEKKLRSQLMERKLIQESSVSMNYCF